MRVSLKIHAFILLSHYFTVTLQFEIEVSHVCGMLLLNEQTDDGGFVFQFILVENNFEGGHISLSVVCSFTGSKPENMPSFRQEINHLTNKVRKK